MREKYLKKLKDLITEMEADRREFTAQERALLSMLRVVFVAFWFHQAEELNTIFSNWRVAINNPVIQDVARLVENDLANAGKWGGKIVPFPE